MSAPRNFVFASWLGRFTAMLVWSFGVQGQGADAFLNVNDARPVAEAVIQLMKRHPVVITYEDPRYTYAGDIKDVTEAVRNPQAAARTNDHRVRVPIGGPLQVRYSLSSEGNKPADLEATLEAIVEAKAALPAGGRFRVEQSGGVFHVIASQVRDESGKWVEHTSVLDTPVTLRSGKLSGHEMIGAILNEVTAATGVKFAVTALPVDSLLAGYRGTVEANNEPARQVLLRTLQGVDTRLTWLLYYSQLTEGYFFNIVAASAAPTAELRGERRLPARQGDASPAGIPRGERSNN